MLEAVNSVLSNASYTKAIADQQSVATSYAANPERVQQSSLQAPYISLYIKVDVDFDRALLQIRDNETGDVVRQIPTESQLEAYRRAQTSNATRPATIKEKSPVELSSPDTGGETRRSEVPNTVTTSAPAPSSAPDTSGSESSSAQSTSVNTEA